jgi:hypothetical protein
MTNNSYIVHEDNMQTDSEDDSHRIESSPEGCEDMLDEYENTNMNANPNANTNANTSTNVNASANTNMNANANMNTNSNSNANANANSNGDGNGDGNRNSIAEEAIGQIVEWDSSAVQSDSANDNGGGAIDEGVEAKEGALASIREDDDVTGGDLGVHTLAGPGISGLRNGRST